MAAKKRALEARRRVPAAAGYRRTRARALTAAQRTELTRPAEGAPTTGKPLRGVTVPGVDLKRGSSGAAVKQLQRALVKLRLMTQAQMNTGPGIFGPLTESSLKRFQRAHG